MNKEIIELLTMIEKLNYSSSCNCISCQDIRWRIEKIIKPKLHNCQKEGCKEYH